MVIDLIEKLLTKILFGGVSFDKEKLDITDDDIKKDLDFKGGHHTER